MNRNKYEKLIEYIKSLESVVVAFSGGVDSTFLLKASKEALGNKIKAVTIISPYIPKWEIKQGEELAKEIGVELEFIKVSILDEIKFNPEDRCYICKKNIFSLIKKFAEENGYKHVIDGTNFDDTKDYRPGLRALGELNIKSPLLENKFTKSEIRDMSKDLGLNTWQKPAYACLLSRIPYGNKIKVEDLEKIENSEKYLMDIGFKAVRVRCHGLVARIEVPKEDLKRLFDINLLENISKKLKKFGFKYVTLDMEGYRVGSLNEDIKK